MTWFTRLGRMLSQRETGDCVGIQWTDTEVRWVESKCGRDKKPIIRSIDAVSLPAGVVVQGKVVQKQPLIDALILLRQRNPNASKMVHLVIPSAQIVTRMYFFPDMDEPKLEQAIAYELQKTKTLPFSNLYMDFLKLSMSDTNSTQEHSERDSETQSTDEQGKGNLPNVMVIATAQETVHEYEKIIAAAKLKLLSIEIQALSWFRLFETLHPAEADETILLAFVSSYAIELNLFSKREFRLHRYILSSEDAIIDTDDASWQTYCRQIAGFVQQFSNYYRYTLAQRDQTIRKFFVAGESEHRDKLITALQTILEMEPIQLHVSDLTQNAFSPERFSRFFVSLGLSLRGEKP